MAVALAVFLAVFALYLLTLPRTVVLEDDGLFILASYFAGVAHPPGYPLFTLLGHLATQLPVGSIAFRVHALSALFGALACLFVWLSVHRITRRALAATVAALALGVSPAFWSQAQVAEVYTFNALFFALLFWCLVGALEWDRSGAWPRAVRPDWKSSRTADRLTRRLAIAALLFGLSLANHWPLMVLSAPALLALTWPYLGLVARRLWMLLPLVAVGLLPYAWVYLRSQGLPVISFYGPLEGWREFWFFVSREGYAIVDSSSTAGWADKAQYMAFWIREALGQFAWVGFPLAVLSLFLMVRAGSRALAASLVLALAGSSVVLIGLLNFDYDEIFKAVFRVYPLVAYLAVSVLLGLGVAAWQRQRHESGPAAAGRFTVVSRLHPALALALPLISLLVHGPGLARADDDWGAVFAETLLRDVPAEASVVVEGDLDLGSVSYLHVIEGLRPDVTLYSGQGVVLPTRLYPAHRISQVDYARALEAHLEKRLEQGVVWARRPQWRRFGELTPLFIRQIPGTEGRMRMHVTERQWALLERVASAPASSDPWVEQYRADYLGRMALVLTLAEFAPEQAPGISARDIERGLAVTRRSLQGLLDEADLRVRHKTRFDAVLVRHLLDEARPRLYPDMIKPRAAAYFIILGRLHQREGEPDAALNAWIQALEEFPSHANEAADLIVRLLKQAGRADVQTALEARFPTVWKPR
ncbi:MAG: protein O-mannosyl-transferase family [Gammaproteobacteria bacterium]